MHAMTQGTPGSRDIDLIASKLKTSTQTRIEYSGQWAQMRMQGHHFGVFGCLICLFEQPVELVSKLKLDNRVEGVRVWVRGRRPGGVASELELL